MLVISAILLAIAGIINVLPIIGFFSVEQLAHSYDIDMQDPTLQVLMRHRAILLGLIGGVMIWASFRHQLFYPASGIGLLSMVSFLWVAWTTNGYSSALQKILIMDLIGILLVILALILRALA